ncbi:MAG: NUDIX hydrolase [Pseudomonadota bacterium]
MTKGNASTADDTPLPKGMAKSAFDREDADDVLVTDQPSVKPKDAATLLLIRRDQAMPRVLMGKRAGGHAFMPHKYVFPGGRVDPQDGRAPAVSELAPNVELQLAIRTRRRPRAFALTAIRETFEETGLIVGKAADVGGRAPPGWEPYYWQGVAPCLKGFTLVGRAVTPPYRPRRFDARFFMAEAEEVLVDERPPADGAELSDLQWVGLDDAMALDIPSVTRFMLEEVRSRLTARDQNPGPAFIRWTRSGHAIDRL